MGLRAVGGLGSGGSSGSGTTIEQGVLWRGLWAADTEYALNDAVRHSGSSYVSLASSLGVSPDSDPEIWDLLAQRGEAGQAGNDGAPGAAGYSPNGLLSGGGVSWVDGLGFVVSAAQYQIGGTLYSSPQTTVNLAAADGSNDRIDAIVVDNQGSVVVLSGTPSATPDEPDVDPASQLQLTIILVPAASVDPGDTTSTTVFSEGSGGEWNTTKSGVEVVVESTNTPLTGTKCIEVTAAPSGRYFQFAPAAPVNLGLWNNLVLNILSKGAWPSARSLTLRFMSGGKNKGHAVSLKEGAFGFASAETSAYQQIVVPLALFGVSGISVDALRCSIAGSGTNLGFHVDDVTLQGGLGGAGSSSMTYRGEWNGTASYVKNDVVRSAGGATLVALLPSTNVAAADGSTWKLIADGTAEVLAKVGLSALSVSGDNLLLTRASDGKQLLLGPFA